MRHSRAGQATGRPVESPEAPGCYPSDQTLQTQKERFIANPIEHIVIIAKENHTFDNYFGTFPGAVGVALPRAPDPQVGTRVTRTRSFDTGHVCPVWS